VPSGEWGRKPISSKRKLSSNANCQPGDCVDGAFENIKHKHDAWDLFKRIVNSNKGTKSWYVGHSGEDQQYTSTDKQAKVIAFQQLLEYYQKLQSIKIELWVGL
jgi:hypothetical protein